MPEPHSATASPARYETRDANTRGVLTFLIILAAVVLGVALVSWGMFRFFTAHAMNEPATNSPFADARQLPMGPQLQVNPRQDLLKYRAEAEKTLETLDWENRSAGTVRIPIEEAMQLLVKKGVPVEGTSQTDAAQKSPAAKKSGGTKQ